mgnify:CR=1 FL=1
MRNHLKHFLLLAVLTICFTATAVAQGTVKGKVVDAENNEPLIGALYRLAVRHWYCNGY